MNGTSIRRNLWAGMAWFAKAFMVLFIAAVVLLPLIAMAWQDLPKDVTVPAGLSASWLSLVGLALALLLMYIAWRVVRALLLYPFGSWNVFGATTSARLIALAVTAIVAPRGVEKLLMIPVTFLLRLMERLTRQASNIPVSFGASGNNGSVNIQEPLARLNFMILDALGEVGRVVNQALESLLTPEVVIAVGLWIVAGNLLSSAVAQGGDAPAGMDGNRLSQYLKSMSPSQQHGMVLTGVFLIGAYLSIAAIVAIPWLHEEKVSPGLSREALEKIIDGILPTATPVDSSLIGGALPNPQEDPLAKLSQFLESRPKPAQSFDGAAYSLALAINDGREARSKALSKYQRMPGDIAQRVGQMRQAAISAFELETATLMSNQERGYFMREIQRSISSDYLRLEAARNNCASALSELDKQFGDLSVFAIATLSAPEPADATDNMRANDQQSRMIALTGPITNVVRSSRSVRDACEAPDLQQAMYSAPVAGSGWGPFGAVARWLLQTKSLALTLITGMLGFGLLGSAIATFVRGGAERGQVSLTAEVTSVLVRGLSAAVVVFLAVKGGLAIFASGDSDPNAYVVFLTCLVGAVFSEDVWAWARNKFLENLQGEGEGAREGRTVTMAESIESKPEPGAAPSPVVAQDDPLN